jgi:hypothetical protein
MAKIKTEDRLFRLIDQALLSGQDKLVTSLFDTVFARSFREQIPFDGAAALEYFWGLARIGAVAVPGAHLTPTTYKMPGFLLTGRGRQLLEKGESSPHNPDKYVAAVRKRAAHPDDIALSYLAEAVEAWRSGLYRSSAVMLGCACEQLVLILGKAMAEQKSLEGSEKVSKALSGRVFISVLFERIRDCLMQLKDRKQLPGELADALDRKLTPIFEYARGLRNESGHPTGGDVSEEDAEAGLLLFPGFYELVDKLVVHCGSAPTLARTSESA